MPEYVLRNVDPNLWSQFSERATREGWPTRALLVALMEAYASEEFTPPQLPPVELPQFAWLRGYYRQVTQESGFTTLSVDAQWKGLTDYILRSAAGMSHGLLDQVPIDRRSQILRWLQHTSVLPMPTGLTLRAIAHIGSGPDLRKDRRTFQYEVLGLPTRQQAWIADFNGGWRILRVVDGVQGEWGPPHATKDDARSVLEELVATAPRQEL